MPSVSHGHTIISNRFRQLLEAEAPGAAQYLPITIEGPDSDKIGQPYWAVNWLRVFECLDKEHSVTDVHEGVERIMFPCVDPRKVPDDGVLGLLGGYTVIVLIRDDLRKKIKAAEMTGFACGGIAHSVEPPRIVTAPRPPRVGRPVRHASPIATPEPAGFPQTPPTPAGTETSLNWSTVCPILQQAAASPPPPAALLAAQRHLLPAPVADAIGKLDVDGDIAHLVDWLAKLLTAEPPSKAIMAFYFGIVDRASSAYASPRSDLYLCGSDWFNPEDEDFEWAVDPAYFPDGRYAGSDVMAALDELEQRHNFVARGFLTTLYAIAAVHEFARRVGPDLMLRAGKRGKVAGRGVAVGHDSGGAWLLGAFAPKGWVRIDEIFEPK